jgi:hypothetical protein
MNRRLVLSNEGAGHPMRRQLPADALRVVSEPLNAPLKWWQQEGTHLFLLSFGAFFTVFYSFIA